MKFCIPYRPNMKFGKSADEYSIVYKRDDSSLADFVQQNSDKTIIIEIHESLQDSDYEKLNLIYKAFGNIKLAFFSARLLQNDKSKLNMPFMILDPVRDFETLHYCFDLGVSDVHVAGGLGFNLKSVSKLCHDRGIQVRCYPNLATGDTSYCPQLQQFFIRPEDTDIYEGYIDVFDFMGEKDKLYIFYKVYKEDRKWPGELTILIQGLEESLNGSAIISEFGLHRISCDRRCLKNGSCRICNNIKELSDTLAKNGYTMKHS